MAFKVECACNIRNGLCVRFGQGKLIKQIDERKKRVAPLIRQRGMRRKAAHVDFRGSFIQSLGGTNYLKLYFGQTGMDIEEIRLICTETYDRP